MFYCKILLDTLFFQKSKFCSCKAGIVVLTLGSGCECLEKVAGTQANELHTLGYNDGGGSRSRFHRKKWSGSYLMTVAGIGASASAYMLWKNKKLVYAAENASQNKDNKKSTSSNDEPESNTDMTESKRDEQTEKKEEIDWSKVPDIPSHVPYLLIGAGIASLEAFKAIKTKDPYAKVLLIGEEDYDPYWRPPLSKQFWFDENKEAYKEHSYTNMRGQKTSVFLLEGLYMEPKKLPYSDRGGLALLKNTKVVSLEAVNKRVTLDNGSQISFDKCLIATGGKPKNDQVLARAGEDVKNRITLFRNYDDLYQLSEAVKTAQSIAVIGGGFLGTELAVGLVYKGLDSNLKVHQVFPEKGNMAKVLPEYLCEWTTNKLKEAGVDVISEATVKAAVYEDGKVKLNLTNGKSLQVDHIVVAVGIEPSTELAESAQLELDDKYGGFRVNTELQARSDIWAAGDCACFYDAKLGRRRVEHFDHAAITGRLAGFNMAGENRPYLHQSMFWSTLGGFVDYEAVGLIDSRLKTFGVFKKKYPQEEDKDDDKKEDTKVVAGTTKQATKSTTKSNPELATCSLEDDYDNGVIFYLRDDQVVGIVLWNLAGFTGDPSRLDIARQVIADGVKDQDLTEVAKLFNVYAK